jgi:hypothetical protein
MGDLNKKGTLAFLSREEIMPEDQRSALLQKLDDRTDIGLVERTKCSKP